jgi:hypothetical protein
MPNLLESTLMKKVGVGAPRHTSPSTVPIRLSPQGGLSGIRTPSSSSSDLTRRAFRETMESLDEVKIWIWGYRAA